MGRVVCRLMVPLKMKSYVIFVVLPILVKPNPMHVTDINGGNVNSEKKTKNTK